MNENTLISLIIAIGPAILSYSAGKKKAAIDSEDSATSHWKELYEASKLERDEWRSDSQSKQQQIDDLKNAIGELRKEVYTLTKSYEDKIGRLKKENIYLKNENERLESELMDIRGN